MRSPFSLRRRTLLASLGAAVVARTVPAQTLSCSNLVIGEIVPKTGPYAAIAEEMHWGVDDAITQSSCTASVIVYHATDHSDQVGGVQRAVMEDNASVIFGLFGPLVLAALEIGTPNSLLVDLKSPAQGDFFLPTNAIAVPYDYFVPLVTDEVDNSVREQARAAASVVLDALSLLEESTPQAVISAIAEQRIESPAGTLLLDIKSGIFRPS